VGQAIKRAVLHYYIALQLGAGAIAPLNLPAMDDGPPPIVRKYFDNAEWRFDPREIVQVGGSAAILTLAEPMSETAASSQLYLN
jgi:hypothetical protein